MVVAGRRTISYVDPMEESSHLPSRFVDAHHHFFDTATHGGTFQSFLSSLMPDQSYLAKHYKRDVIQMLESAGIRFIGSVHVECLPDDGCQEAAWVMEESSSCSCPPPVKAIVASCNLGQQDTSNVDLELGRLASFPEVKGIRWILDCVGKFQDGKTPTHVATIRHNGVDFLRGSEGGYNAHVIPSFEKGFALLAKHNLTFDLQCAPVQLLEASKLCSKYPSIKVVIDHLGKPRPLISPKTDDDQNTISDEKELAAWRAGMKAMASNRNVYVKISMVGYAVPGWIRSSSRMDIVRSLVQETVALFGPRRCMVGTNYFHSAAMSDSGGESSCGPTPLDFLKYIYGFLKDDCSDDDLDCIFASTAIDFYNITC
jgi:predicted TIM-barrel fold metal-dependent hydrolase